MAASGGREEDSLGEGTGDSYGAGDSLYANRGVGFTGVYILSKPMKL